MNLLDVRNLSVSFGAHRVVNDVSFSLDAGEKLALVGESGSGKTVTALSTMRLIESARLQGEVLFKGRDILKMPPNQLRALRGSDIAMVFQEPMTALNPVLTIGVQIMEALQWHKGLDRVAARAAAIASLERVGIADAARRVDSYPHQLSGGQRQRAMIAMALACNPKLLIADEPTTALDVSIRMQILALLDELRVENGLAILIITHDLNLVRRFANHVAVMENGVLVEQGSTDDVMNHPQHPYTRKLINSRPVREVQGCGQAPVLHGQKVRVTYPTPLPGFRGWFKQGEFVAVHEANFTLASGETLGIIGESGSGKTTLAMALLNLTKSSGEIRIGQMAWQGQSRKQSLAQRRKIQVVFQDPLSSLSPRLTIEAIVGEGLEIHEPQLSADERRSRILKSLCDVGLAAEGQDEAAIALLNRYPHEFSGGQRQRIAIARALVIQPQIVVLDEPTSALDVTIQQQVLRLLAQLQQRYGLSYVLVTHDIDVIRAMAHRVMVMKSGKIVESGAIEEILDHPKNAYTRELIAAGM